MKTRILLFVITWKIWILKFKFSLISIHFGIFEGFPNGKETVNLAKDVVQRLEEGKQSDETFEKSHNTRVDSNVGSQEEDVDPKANTGEREINEGDDDQSDLRLERSFLF